MEARFDSGRCGMCDQPIKQGEEIVYIDDEWVHEECAEDHPDR